MFNIDDPTHIEVRFNESDISASTSSRKKTVKLPSIDIPKFSDELTQWPTFFSAFEAASTLVGI